MVRLVAVAQATQHLNGLLDGRLFDEHRREAAIQRRVALDILAVLVERRRADAVQFAARQGWLHHVAGVQRTGCGPRADDLMQFVNEEDDLALGALNLLDGGLQPLLELAAETAASDHCAQVEADHAAAHQNLRHVAAGDLLGQPLDDGRFADARLADQHGVVLGAAAENLDDAQDFVVAPDHRVELALDGQARQVAAVLFQRAVARLRLRVGHALPAANVLDHVVDALFADARIGQDARHCRASLAEDGQEEMLGADVLVLEAVGFFVGDVHHPLDARRDEHLAGAAAIDGRLGAGAQQAV